MTHHRIFGTDGVRGHYGEGWLTPHAVSAIGRTVGLVLTDREGGVQRERTAVIGHDGRRSGTELEAAVARGLAAAGYQPVSVGLITTPGLALITRLSDFDVGVMISASHNPASDNGVKVFGPEGHKLEDEVELAVEERLRADPSPATEPFDLPRAGELEDVYLEHLLTSAGELRLDGRLIALDCANGGGSRVAPRVLRRLGAQVVEVACEPDGDNINAGCGSTHPELLQEAVRRSECDLGIALDGDGDRCVLVDEDGRLVHGDAVLTLLARDAKARNRLPGDAIVATVMSNRGLHRALREVGIEVMTVGVGDRRVVEGLRAHGLALGGEQSGHIVFGADNGYVGDGTYTALRVLATLSAAGGKLSDLTAPFRPFPQVLVNVRVERKPNLGGLPSIVDAVRAVEEELGEDGRVLLRYSGTEPLARVMVEGPDEARIRERARGLAEILQRELGTAG